MGSTNDLVTGCDSQISKVGSSEAAGSRSGSGDGAKNCLIVIMYSE